MYGVATTSSLLKITSLFCKRALWKRRYSAKETCNFKEPTNGSPPIVASWLLKKSTVSVLFSQTHTHTHTHTYIHTHIGVLVVISLFMQRTSTHCDTLQNTATHTHLLPTYWSNCSDTLMFATRCNTLQHTATHCITYTPATHSLE